MERINSPNAVEFLKQVFQRAMQTKMSNIVNRIPPDLLKFFKNVWLEDCSVSETRGRITFADDN